MTAILTVRQDPFSTSMHKEMGNSCSGQTTSRALAVLSMFERGYKDLPELLRAYQVTLEEVVTAFPEHSKDFVAEYSQQI